MLVFFPLSSVDSNDITCPHLAKLEAGKLCMTLEGSQISSPWFSPPIGLIPATEVIFLRLAVGGVSLNLTAASHVIHCDRCYNPAKYQQANDRAHRFRQYQSVCVHTLVTSGTFEECLDDIMIDAKCGQVMSLESTEDRGKRTNTCHRRQ